MIHVTRTQVDFITIRFASSFLTLALIASCANGRTPSTGDGGNGDASTDGSSDLGTHPSDVLSVVIEPSTVTLTSIDGATPTQTFTAIGTRRDGTSMPLTTGEWELDALSLGSIHSANGTFTASGLIGGSGTVTFTDVGAQGIGLSATASVTVNLERIVMGEGATTDTPARFDSTTPVDDATRSANVVYPLQNAVMPQNVYPANVQWTRANSGDAFRITLAKSHIRVVGYVAYSGLEFGMNWLVDVNAWRALAQTDPDDDVVIKVDRYTPSPLAVINGNEVRMRFARAALTGSIYYWNIAAGRIERIDDGAGEHSDFLPHPPVARDGERCVGCHSVSNSGRYMAGRLGGSDNVGGIFDLTTDLTGDPAPTVWPVTIAPDSVHWWFSSWSPDDSRLIVEQNLALGLIDPNSGATISPLGVPLPTANTTHPSWSRDGNNIAVTTNTNAWGGANTRGDIALVPYSGSDTFGAMHVIHEGDSLPNGSADSYPSFAPDSIHIAFAHGTGSRSESETSSLYYMKDDGSDVVRLDNACGGASTLDNYQPRFSPFVAGGYYWLSFLSKRDYGNSRVGTAGAERQQIWVAAIAVDPPAPGDPSAVAYWLPGQDTTSQNIAAYWAPRPCRVDGETCTVGSECCGGDCRPGDDGTPVCAPPPEEECREEGQTCSTSADCCDPFTCFGHVCVRAPT